MIIFLADGRLGNQIFQYVFLKTIQKNKEKIIVSGFEDLREVFEIDDVVNLNKKNRWFRGVLFKICKPMLYFLSNKKVISNISVNHEKVLDNYRRESTTYTKQKGLFSYITFVKLGYFQSEDFFDKDLARHLYIKNKYLEEANKFSQNIPQNTHKVFVHIRRGDYCKHTVYGNGTLLPMYYFKEQIEWFLKNTEAPFFIFLSDEPEFIGVEFEYLENKIISSNNHFGTDLAIMTQCKSAILSPSSFSWWGSYFMKDRNTIFTPKYWLGFNSGIEHPKKSIPSYSTEIEI